MLELEDKALLYWRACRSSRSRPSPLSTHATMSEPRERFLTEQDAHRVLARAVELDAPETVPDVSLEQLHAIAAEAGISPTALERALDELRTGILVKPVTLAEPRSLGDRLAHYRRYALLVIVAGVAAATPGDVLGVNLQYVLPLYALYELAVRITQRRAGPSAPVSGTPGVASVANTAPSSDVRRGTRSLVLRPGIVTPAI
jgi:hypothetical protein